MEYFFLLKKYYERNYFFKSRNNAFASTLYFLIKSKQFIGKEKKNKRNLFHWDK